MRPSLTLTTPPIAPEPYSSVAGPLSTSMRSARNGSMPTAWSWLIAETSPAPRPSLSTATRGPSRPRMTGRPAACPKAVVCTPGRLATVWPSVLARASSRSVPLRTLAGVTLRTASRDGAAPRTVTTDSSVCARRSTAGRLPLCSVSASVGGGAADCAAAQPAVSSRSRGRGDRRVGMAGLEMTVRDVIR